MRPLIIEPIQDWIQKWPFFAVIIFLFLMGRILSLDFWNRVKNPLNKVYVNK